MSAPPPPPFRRDPQRRTPVLVAPPTARSRAGHALAAAAARGAFALQICARCGTVQYPPRDACRVCLSVDLPWRAVAPEGRLIAVSTVRTSVEPYFRERVPWRVGTVAMDAGPSVVAHLHGDVARGERVRLALRLDRAGLAAMVALPSEETPHMHDDPLLRELSAHPRHRRALVTDGRVALGQAVARALLDAGAARVFVGEARGWLPYPGRDALRATEGVEVVALDLTDTGSVRDLAGAIGGRVDILVNTAEHVRPGGVTERRGVAGTRDELETNVLGLMRLAQSFGPAMAARGADGVDNAVAFVEVLSVGALAGDAAFGAHAVSQAAALSLARTLRRELRSGGVRVLTAFLGPLDDEWRRPLPPPKVAPERAAREIVAALVHGVEEVFVGEVARDVAARWREDAGALLKEIGA